MLVESKTEKERSNKTKNVSACDQVCIVAALFKKKIKK